MNISAIVIAFNPICDLLLTNIFSYEDQVDQIIIVDNSTDLSIKKGIENMCFNKKYHYYDMKSNKGIAAALNAGFDAAIKCGSDWALTMDQDSSFHSDLEGFKSYIKNKDILNVLLLAPIYNCYNVGLEKNTKTTYLKVVIQSGNLINIYNYLKVGPYREDFFIDFVDYEFCLRSKAYELKICQINSVILKHEPGVIKNINFLGIKYKYFSSLPIRYYYVVRNGITTAYIYKNLWCFLIVIKSFMRIILIEENKKIKLNFVFKAITDFLKSNYGMYNKV